MFLPYPWWKLGFLWLSGLKARRAPGRGKALFQNSLRVSILGLALSVASLSLTLAIVSGFQKNLARGVSGSLGHVVHFTKWRSFNDFEKILAQAPTGVERVEAVWTSQALVVGPKGGRGVLIEGRKTLFPKGADAVELSEDEQTAVDAAPAKAVEIQLGKALAQYLGVNVGGQVKLLLPGILKGPAPAKVVALKDHGMHDIDSRLLWINDQSLRTYLERESPEELGQRPGDAHGLRFYLDDTYSQASRQKDLDGWIANYTERVKDLPRLGEPNPLIKSWEEQKRNLFGAIGMDKAVLSVVLSLLTLVAALNVAATLVVLFLERDREIAVLQSIGMSRGQLIQWISLQGFLTGLMGSILGIGLAFLFAWLLQKLDLAEIPPDVYNLTRIPTSFEWKEQLGVFVFGLGSAFIVSLAIALRLSNVNVVQLMGFRR